MPREGGGAGSKRESRDWQARESSASKQEGPRRPAVEKSPGAGGPKRLTDLTPDRPRDPEVRERQVVASGQVSTARFRGL